MQQETTVEKPDENHNNEDAKQVNNPIVVETSSHQQAIDEDQQYDFRKRNMCGIVNIGNTCYLNSALQALCSCKALFEALQYDEKLLEMFNSNMEIYKRDKNFKQQRKIRLCYLFKAINSHLITKNSTVNIREFVHLLWNVYPAFRPYYQEDSQELVQFVLDLLHEECKTLVNDDFEGVVNREDKFIMQYIRKQHEEDFKKDNEASEKKTEYKPLKQYISPITDIFRGYLLNEVTCHNCNHISPSVNSFLDLSLPIPEYTSSTISQQQQQDDSDDKTKITTPTEREFEQQLNFFQLLLKYNICNCPGIMKIPALKLFGNSSETVVDLFDCLDLFFEADTLDQYNYYKCSVCKSMQESTKKFSLIKLPKVLCLHLKRFHQTQSGFFSGFFSSGSITKRSELVRFPDEFRADELKRRYMKDFVPPSPTELEVDFGMYRLTAVVNHHGYGMSSGHYTSYVRGANDIWYHCDDSRISRVSAKTVHSSQAYILFYELT